jgi:hypothetical protein
MSDSFMNVAHVFLSRAFPRRFPGLVCIIFFDHFNRVCIGESSQHATAPFRFFQAPVLEHKQSIWRPFLVSRPRFLIAMTYRPSEYPLRLSKYVPCPALQSLFPFLLL